MTDRSLFYYPSASFTNAQLPLLKIAALYFDKLAILDPVGASRDTNGADFHAGEAAPPKSEEARCSAWRKAR